MSDATKPSESPVEREAGTGFETFKALLVAIVLAFAIRSFLFEPFKIPSGSMIPTLLVGDYLVVNKFAYGLRLPVTGTLLIPVGEPQRGDIVVFRYPDDPSTDFIKRVIGVPGDTIRIDRGGRLHVNGQVVDRVEEGVYSYFDHARGTDIEKLRFREINPDRVEYTIIHEPGPAGPRRGGPWAVPRGKYFMMGDNRDNSRDSRLWTHAYVSSDQLKGRAILIHWSWVVDTEGPSNRNFLEDFLHTLYRVVTFQIEEIRWDRVGRGIDGVAD